MVKIKKTTVGVNLMRKLNLLTRLSLLTVYKCFIRPHLDYGDVIYDLLNLSSLVNKLKELNTTRLYLLRMLLKKILKKIISRVRF